MGIARTVVSALFPGICASCGDITESDGIICDSCEKSLKTITKDKLCLKCGNPKDNCVCKVKHFFYNGCAAPYYRSGVAKRLMYSLKFGRNMQVTDFFCQKMADCLKLYYSGIKFDYITYVPLSRLVRIRRGFNQSEILSKGISRITGIPVKRNVIRVNKHKKVQHNLPVKQRYENVKGAYRVDVKLGGGVVLLVDDIKTTGATLSECAKALKGAGADKVYCVAGLISKIIKKQGITEEIADRKGNYNGT